METRTPDTEGWLLLATIERPLLLSCVLVLPSSLCPCVPRVVPSTSCLVSWCSKWGRKLSGMAISLTGVEGVAMIIGITGMAAIAVVTCIAQVAVVTSGEVTSFSTTKCLPTFRTLIVLFLRMDNHVLLQISLTTKCLHTFRTLIVLFSSRDSHVCLQIFITIKRTQDF